MLTDNLRQLAFNGRMFAPHLAEGQGLGLLACCGVLGSVVIDADHPSAGPGQFLQTLRLQGTSLSESRIGKSKGEIREMHLTLHPSPLTERD